MQQVATKGSQIAALPIELEISTTQSVNTHDQFRQALEQTANRNAVKDKKGEISPVWKAPERKPSSAHTDKHTSEKVEPSNIEVQAAKKTEVKPAVAVKSEQSELKPSKTGQLDNNDDTNWLELVESVKEYNENPDKAALANVAETVLGDEANLSDELASKIEALFAKLGEDSAISEDEISILTAIQEQLSDIETDGENPLTLTALFNNISQKLNDMVAKAVESGKPVESPKTTALATAMLNLQSTQSVTEDSSKAALDSKELVNPVDDLEEAAKLLVSLIASEKHKSSNTHPLAGSSQFNEKTALPQHVEKLMQNMQQFSESGRKETEEAIVDRVLKLLPSTANEQQQQAVKNLLTAGLNEMNAQLAQGREPGISLQDMIAGAMAEANIQLDNSMKHQLESQLALINSAVQASQQSMAAEVDRQALTSADISLRENSQIRSEMSKGQQAADGLDKPVNIQRAEGQQQLNEKIRWMMNSRSSLAEIRLDPPELGSMQVRVNVSGDTANVNFVVQTQHAKDALAEAENRLRDMLAEQGITLGESFVQQQNSQQGNEDGQFAGNGQSGESFESEEQTVSTESSMRKRDTDGIDDYA